jgi:hypothetical protein
MVRLFENRAGDAASYQFRIGYHPGVRIYSTPRRRHQRQRRPQRRQPSAQVALRAVHVEVGKASTVTGMRAIPMATR